MGLKSKIQKTVVVIAALTLSLSGGAAFAEVPVAGALTVTAANPSYTVTVSNPAYTEDYPGTNTNLYTLGSPLSVLSTSVAMSLSVTSANLNTGNVDVLLDGSLSPSGSMVYSLGTGLWSYSLTDPAAFTLGTHNLRSTFMDMDGGAGNTVPVTIRYDVVKAGQTISFASMPDMPYGPTITLAATASSGLPVSYSIVGGTGTATISGNGLKPTLVGTIIVEAAQAGNNTYAAAAPVDQTINVIKASPVINLAAVTNLAYDGAPKTVTLSATPSSLLGAVVVTYNGSTTPPTALGTYSVVATRPADDNHNEATASGVLNIIKSNRTVSPDLIFNTSANTWSAQNTKFVVAGDFDRDGVDENVAIYGYNNGDTGVWIFDTNGSVTTSRQMLLMHPSTWNLSLTKFAISGDFNNDGYTDVEILYDYGNGQVGLWSFESNGSTMVPRQLYASAKGFWNASATKSLTAGDFNKDGYTDVAAMYDYGNGQICLWSFESNGSTMVPRQLYVSAKGFWNASATKSLTAGDFNKDGYTDVAAMYDYGNGQVGLWSFESNGSTMVPRQLYASARNTWYSPSIKFVVSGDFNADGITDVAAMYDYGNGQIGLWSFESNGSTMVPRQLYASAKGFWNASATKFVTTGNFDGDAYLDFAAMYDYGKAQMGLWNFR